MKSAKGKLYQAFVTDYCTKSIYWSAKVKHHIDIAKQSRPAAYRRAHTGVWVFAGAGAGKTRLPAIHILADLTAKNLFTI